MKRVVVDLEKCMRCGLCAARCPFGALRLAETGLLHAPGKCAQDCEVCRLVCPKDAVLYEALACGGCSKTGGRRAGCSGCAQSGKTGCGCSGCKGGKGDR